jgi:hypothetical protein
MMQTFPSRSAWLLSVVLCAGASAACVSPVASDRSPCPCAGSNVCCPSGLCAPDQATCDRDSSMTLATAPIGLNFVRLDATKGRFSWDPVQGATKYVLFRNGAPAMTMIGTQADLDIGAGMVEVTVAAQNTVGMSPVSSVFPVLFDVKVRACGTASAAVWWSTQGPTDTQLAIQPEGDSTLTCFDPTPRMAHHYSEISQCLNKPSMFMSYGMIRPEASTTLSLLSRDELGFLGEYNVPLQLPPWDCMCAWNSHNPYITNCQTSITNELRDCPQGFDLETGQPAPIGQADVYLEAVENADGLHLDETRIVAPNGLIAVLGHPICEIDAVPDGPYTTSVQYEHHADFDPNGFSGQSSSVIIRTKSGRYAKLGVLCNCASGGSDPDPNDPEHTLLSISGMIFSWILAPEGSAVFDR